MSIICKSLGLSLETRDNFLRVSVSVSKGLVSKKSLGFGIEKFGLVKKVSVSVLENLVSEKKVSVSVSENLVSEKKSRYWYRKNLSRIKSLGLGIGQNFGLVTQWLLGEF